MPTAPTSFRLSPSERAAVMAAADAAGLGVSSFARQAAVAAAGRRADVRRKPDGTAEALAQCARPTWQGREQHEPIGPPRPHRWPRSR